MKLNVTDDDPRKRNHSTENIKKSNQELTNLLETANKYFYNNINELSRGTVIPLSSPHERIPKLYKLPELLKPIIAPAKAASVVSEASEFKRNDLNTRLDLIADLYNLKLDKKEDGTIDFSKNSEDLAKAKAIDLNARKMSSNFPVLTGSDFEKEALEDFMACNWAWFFEETPY